MGKAMAESELIGLRERVVVLERHLAQKYCCGSCHQKVVVADSQADRLVPGGRYSVAFACDVAYRKYCLHLPWERQVKDLGRSGLVIETSTLWDQTDELATLLTPTWQEICRRGQAEAVLYADKTPFAILSNGKTKRELLGLGRGRPAIRGLLPARQPQPGKRPGRAGFVFRHADG